DPAAGGVPVHRPGRADRDADRGRGRGVLAAAAEASGGEGEGAGGGRAGAAWAGRSCRLSGASAVRRAEAVAGALLGAGAGAGDPDHGRADDAARPAPLPAGGRAPAHPAAAAGAAHARPAAAAGLRPGAGAGRGPGGGRRAARRGDRALPGADDVNGLTGAYVPGDSPLHRMPVGAKLAGLAACCVVLFLLPDMWAMAGAAVVVVLLYGVTRVGAAAAWAQVRPVRWFAAGLFVIQFVLAGPVPAVMVSSRIVLAVALAGPGTLTTRTSGMG